jgi:hypothetical protein
MRYLIRLTRATAAALILGCVLSAAATTVPAQTVYDAVNDFSITSPTGLWSYGYTATRGSLFLPYNQAHTDIPQYNGPGLDMWNLVNTGIDPAFVAHNRSGELRIFLTVKHPAHLLNLHPGSSGQNSVVRWTAPSAGLYEVKGRFQSIDDFPGTTDVYVLHNSGGTLFSGLINALPGAAGGEAKFTLLIYVEANDTIDFSVGNGGNGYRNDSTGMSATIKPFAISGRVTDGCGLGLGGVAVRLESGAQRTVTATTDADGRYSFNLTLVGRSYTVTALLEDTPGNRFQYAPESYTFSGMSEPQTANFVRLGAECPPQTFCREDPPCPLKTR